MILFQKYCILFVLMFSTQFKKTDPYINEFIVYNVGQGQWLAHKTAIQCLHFDMGGEYFPKRVPLDCKNKKNYLNLSHWDWDHISFIKKFIRIDNLACLLTGPRYSKQRWSKKLLNLSKSPNAKIIIDCQSGRNNLLGSTELEFKNNLKNANELSRIFWKDQVLIMGDASTKTEALLLENLNQKLASNLLQTKILILGHHGSRTSTSDELLKYLPNLKMAISSARHKKYGHPHLAIQNKLKSFNVALLKTEDWGNIHFELK